MKKNYALFFVILTCISLSFIHCPLFNIFFDDKEFFKYTGMVLQRGGVPYRDFFDHKPPLIFFLNYFGLLIGTWGLWLIDTALVLLATLTLYNTCRKYKVALAWLPPVIFNLMIRNQTVSYGIGMTREYSTIFMLIAFCLLMRDHKYKFYLQGILAGLIFFFAQDQVLPLLPVLLFAFFTNIAPSFASFLKRALSLAAGFLTVATPIILYFFINHSLLFFWQDAFLFNFNWYTKREPILLHAKAIRNALHFCEYDIIVYCTLIIGAASLLWKHKKKWLLGCSLAAVLLSFSAELLTGSLLSGIDLIYYFLPLSATVPFTLFVVFAFSEETLFSDRRPQIVLGAIFAFNLFFHIAQYSINLSPNEPSWPERDLEYAYLKKQQLNDYDLYVLGESNYTLFYNDFRILAPSKWIYQFFWRWFENWDADNRKLKSITDDLRKHHTKYIVDRSDSIRLKNPNNLQYWKSFLRENYDSVYLGPVKTRSTIWKIKQVP
jgi:hypothetical protein